MRNQTRDKRPCSREREPFLCSPAYVNRFGDEKKGSMKGEDEEMLSNQHSQISKALKKVLNFHFTFFPCAIVHAF